MNASVRTKIMSSLVRSEREDSKIAVTQPLVQFAFENCTNAADRAK